MQLAARRSLPRILTRRLVFAVPILIGVVTIAFVITRVVPRDPAYLIAGQYADEEVLANIRRDLGTDRPIVEQYWNYLADAARLDFGKSFFTGNDVSRDLADRLPLTLELVGTSLIVALILGIGMGSYAARRRGGFADALIRFGSFSLLSIPVFWLALILIYVFFFRLGVAPAPMGDLPVGMERPTPITGAGAVDALLTANFTALRAALGQLALPVLAMGVPLAAPVARLTRSAVLEALGSEFISFGYVNGLPPLRLWWYAVRGALPPVLTFGAILLSELIGGAVLIETVFSWGGAAQYAVQAIRSSDYPAIQGFVIVSGVLSVGVFLVVDLLYVAIDPRVEL